MEKRTVRSTAKGNRMASTTETEKRTASVTGMWMGKLTAMGTRTATWRATWKSTATGTGKRTASATAKLNPCRQLGSAWRRGGDRKAQARWWGKHTAMAM